MLAQGGYRNPHASNCAKKDARSALTELRQGKNQTNMCFTRAGPKIQQESGMLQKKRLSASVWPRLAQLSSTSPSANPGPSRSKSTPNVTSIMTCHDTCGSKLYVKGQGTLPKLG
mmetsp:Transcript_91127/g.217376  ORF Transcript_91127/g.217376 Transcript_91127/m.217376 type:complete len:115 (-) Transcript_91127:119-463(-)